MCCSGKNLIMIIRSVIIPASTYPLLEYLSSSTVSMANTLALWQENLWYRKKGLQVENVESRHPALDLNVLSWVEVEIDLW